MLLSVPLGIVTSTVPVVAPVGTVVLISDLETTVNFAAVPLKRDTGRARQIRSWNLDRRSQLAGSGQGLHKWAQTHSRNVTSARS